MTTPNKPSGDALHRQLGKLLQEPDPRRPLDSLETLVVLAYLEHRHIDVGREQLEAYPETIEQWVAWVAKRRVVGADAAMQPQDDREVLRRSEGG